MFLSDISNVQFVNKLFHKRFILHTFFFQFKTIVSNVVSITTTAMSSNPTHGEVYSIQNYVIKFCQRLTAGLWFSSPIKLTATI